VLINRRRLIYSITAGLTLIPMAAFTWLADGPWVVVWPWPWKLLLVPINLAALGLGVMALRAYGGATDLFGLKKNHRPPTEPVRTGVLGWIRHPLYLTALVLLWAHNLRLAGLVTSAVLTLYVLAGTVIEEHRLARQWGPAWEGYRAEVSPFIPLKRLRSIRGPGGQPPR
jgi:protein-S-isoprenylcysteine O-methyltransferase Ste14